MYVKPGGHQPCGIDLLNISKKEMQNLKPNSLYTKSMISGMFDEGGMSTEVKRKKM